MGRSKLAFLISFLLIGTFLQVAPVSAYPIYEEIEQAVPEDGQIVEDESLENELVAEEEQAEEQPAEEVFEPPRITPLASWVGVATYYSHAGCLGCSRGQIMANGRPFREHALTIAFMRARLGCKVLVTNRNNGWSTQAEVTDRGGFEKYGIIADLSVGTRNAIGGGHKTPVKIDLLGC